MPNHDNDGEDSLSYSELERIVSICDRFERALSAGERPGIETFLTEFDNRDALLAQLLLSELEFRKHAGENPSPDEYLARFPDHSTVIHAVFAQETAQSEDSEPGGCDPSPVDDPTVRVVPGVATEPIPENGSIAEQPVEFGTEPAPDQITESRDRSPTFETGEYQGGSGPEPTTDSNADPTVIGRYIVVRLLGEGSFGKVYLARDEVLKRMVAIKVPRRQSLRSTRQVETLLNEARIAAQFTNPAIVAVHDSGRQPDGSVYIVFEYIDGKPLSKALEDGGFPLECLVGLLARVAEAVHYAHQRGLVHRDLKPENILVDTDRNPHVADFGLAMRQDLQRLRFGEVAGTASYMAPEQVRGETHRLDCRTDIWALGVILYRVLAGRPPFSGDRHQLFDEILHREPRPLKQIDDAIPIELDRICQKCLSKLMTDRYSSALDFAEDLRAWLAEGSRLDPEPRSRAIRIGPKGPRAFDWSDAESFLNLLPGPRGRDGLPASVSFWKTRIEHHDGEKTFSVGLLYGPSGSGKTSLVKAGILPRLNKSVRPFYVEASPERTEAQLSAALKRGFPELPAESGLVETVAAIREGDSVPPGVKVLLVLDQFEQWLYAHLDEPHAELLGALRQCDGQRLQALLLVRDDFWMAIARLFKAMEIPLVEGGNSAPAELFDAAHARKVLVEFGIACERLPGGPAGPGPEASRFLDQAVREMTGSDGRVMPVRLSLFAEMVRRRPWTPDTLRTLGGVEGIGVTFIKEAFDLTTSPPLYRLHRKAAESVLQALLPAPTSVLRGRLRSGRELREAAGHGDRPGDFAELMRILDTELRMVTPVDPEGTGEEQPSPRLDPGEAYYQLAHDFLIGPIREWIERKRKATRSGRARLRLAIIAASWVDRPSPKRLPSPVEWAGILWYTKPRTWSADERRMMETATRHHLIRAAAALALVGAVSFVFKHVLDGERAVAALGRARDADYRNLAGILPELDSHMDRLRPQIERLEHDPKASDRERGVALLLLYRDQPTSARGAALRSRLREVGPEEVSLIRDALAAHPSQAGLTELGLDLVDEAEPLSARLRIACALVGLGPVNAEDWKRVAPSLARALVVEDRHTVSRWLELLGPVAGVLVPSLGQFCSDRDRDASSRFVAAEVLAEALVLLGDSPGLARWLTEAQPEGSLVLLSKLEGLPDRAPAFKILREMVDAEPLAGGDDARVDRRAAAAVALAVLGYPDRFREALRHRENPSLRTRTIQKIANLGLATRNPLGHEWAELDSAQRQAVLLAWAETPVNRLTPAGRDEIVQMVRDRYVDDPDPGVHSAAELLLNRWGRADQLVLPDADKHRHPSPTGGRGWEPGPNGHTFVILPGHHVFQMGSPENDPDRYSREQRHYRLIDRTLAVATTEVMIEQFQKFKSDYVPDTRYAREPGCPAGDVTWYEAIRYCNWLSKKDGLRPDQRCYPDDEDIKEGMVLPDDAFDRPGYRLPTEAEWEYFCRAGTETRRPWGDSDEFLSRYAWTWLNSQARSAPVGRLLPNEFGLFDTIGNLYEWCHDGPSGPEYWDDYPHDTDKDHPAPDQFHGAPTTENWRIVRGGVYDDGPATARSAHRDIFKAGSSRFSFGFRVVRTVVQTTSASE